MRDALFSKNGQDFCKAFDFWNKAYFHYNFDINPHNDNENIYVINDCTEKLNVVQKERLRFYKKGLKARLQQLSDEYFLNQIPFQDGDIVVDCGANIGEIGLCLKQTECNINYHPIEPSEKEANACDLNNFEGQNRTTRKALWNKNEIIKFYNKGDTADNSVFEIENSDYVSEVEAITLDSFCLDKNIDTIKWFKLEAEGAEPEILEGAKNIIQKISYISVDCGFERGIEQKHTVSETINFLLGHGFEMVDMKFDRIVCLFKNKSL